MKTKFFFVGAILFLMTSGCSVDGNEVLASCIPPPSGENLETGKTNLTVLALLGPNSSQAATNISVQVDGNWYGLSAQSKEAYSDWETIPSINISRLKFYSAGSEHTIQVANSATQEPAVLFITQQNGSYTAELKNFLGNCRDTF